MTLSPVTTMSSLRRTSTLTLSQMKVTNCFGDVLFANYILHFPGSGTGGEDTIKIVGESLGLNNWQTVAAIIGESLERVKTFEI